MINLIKSVLSPLSAMKIEPNEKNLQKKLHLITQHLINAPKQFDAWMQLQNQNNLHASLEQIYDIGCESSQYSEEDLAAIFQLYTLLLINCRDQLLVCKLVSDQFVIKLCRMERMQEGKAYELEPYQINLIKAYLGTTSHEAVKYMVIEDQFKVFQECVTLYQGKAGTVQQTTIANSILNIIKKVDELNFLWESIWVPQGLMRLYKQSLTRIEFQLGQKQPEDLQETILFIYELIASITIADYLQKIKTFCGEYFDQILSKIETLDFDLRVRAFCLCFPLFKAYDCEKDLIQNGMMWFVNLLQNLEDSTNANISESTLMAMFAANKIITSPFSQLSERALSKQQTEKVQPLRERALKILMNIVRRNPQLIKQMSAGLSVVYLSYIREVLRMLFHLKMVLYPQNQYLLLSIAVLELFQAYTLHFKGLLSKNEQWSTIIRWYDEGSQKVTKELLENSLIFQHRKENPSTSILITFQLIRNFRFMIADTTTLDPKAIKQQKFHHSTFSSVGMTFQPNSMVQAGMLSVVTPCIVHHNYHQIPAVIAEDRQCFIVGFKATAEQYKILINVKFTDIEGFVYGDSGKYESKDPSQLPKFVRINLKGAQQINLQFSNPKIGGMRFKEYLIKSKDNARQRHLTFLHSWVKIYEQDTIRSLQKLRSLDKLHELEQSQGTKQSLSQGENISKKQSVQEEQPNEKKVEEESEHINP